MASRRSLSFFRKELILYKYQRYLQDYLACIAAVDKSVGEVLDFLKENGLDKNTVVVYASDQRFYLGEHGWFDKRWMFEESYRYYDINEWELYDLKTDPQEMKNVYNDPAYASIKKNLHKKLSSLLYLLQQLAVSYKAFDLTIFIGPKLCHSSGLSYKEIAVGGKI